MRSCPAWVTLVVSVGVVCLMAAGPLVGSQDYDVIEGASVTVVDGAINIVPPPVAHFIENPTGMFKWSIGFGLADTTTRKTWIARVDGRIWREEGDFGSNRWYPIWSRNASEGNRRRHRRLRFEKEGPLETPIFVQTVPVVRYRIEIRAHAHGDKPRSKRINVLMAGVLCPTRGRKELAPTLLLCREASLVHQGFKDFFLHLKGWDRRSMRRSLARMHSAVRRLDDYAFVLPGSQPAGVRVAWPIALSRAATASVGVPTMHRSELLMPYAYVMDKLAVQTLRDLVGRVEHEKALAACQRAITALETYGYQGTITAENLRHELETVEHTLLIDQDSYNVSLMKAQEAFARAAGHRGWGHGPEPEEKYLKETFDRVERFFNIPRHALGLQVAVMRGLRGLRDL